MLKTWATAMNDLNQTLGKAPIDPNLTKLIIIATRSWHDTKQPLKPEFLPNEYHRLFNRQSKIGWHHISKGRLSIAWYQQQKKWNPITPERWITYIITSIWTTIRKIWDIRNQQLHESEAAEQRETIMLQLEPKIRDLYHNSTKLGVFDRKHFERPIEEILQLPTPSIQQWIHKMKQKIRDGIIRERKRLEQTNTSLTTIWKTTQRRNKSTGNTTTTQTDQQTTIPSGSRKNPTQVTDRTNRTKMKQKSKSTTNASSRNPVLVTTFLQHTRSTVQRTKIPQQPTRTNTEYDQSTARLLPDNNNNNSDNNQITQIPPIRTQQQKIPNSTVQLPSSKDKQTKRHRNRRPQKTEITPAENKGSKSPKQKSNTEAPPLGQILPTIAPEIIKNNTDPKSDPAQYRPP
jgi:hypothetical protein